MLRFIFLCMGVVALSMLSIGMQFMTDGIQDEQALIAARNTPQDQTANIATANVASDEISPEALNNIESAAGGESDLMDYFGAPFTNNAPEALAEPAQAQENIY